MLKTKWSFLKLGLRRKSISSMELAWVPRSPPWCDFTRKLPAVMRMRVLVVEALVPNELSLHVRRIFLPTPCTSSPHASSSTTFLLDLRLQISLYSFLTSQEDTRMLAKLRLLAKGRIVCKYMSLLAFRRRVKSTLLGDIILWLKFLHVEGRTPAEFL